MREQRDLDALSWLGMNSVAVKKFQFFSRRRDPDFDEAAVFGGNAKRSLSAENLHRKRVEEFIGENDDRNLGG